ncbi:hypothetical protein BA177_09340 [Woeseia oceani]|uniref:Uncharacterized protein n=1 Tax=Woeseia oceani TaxID=1548547 RepID=A0A193LFR2_9GAMM|nr:hypothetical protein BA177_09340 [Woeseia oceani]
MTRPNDLATVINKLTFDASKILPGLVKYSTVAVEFKQPHNTLGRLPLAVLVFLSSADRNAAPFRYQFGRVTVEGRKSRNGPPRDWRQQPSLAMQAVYKAVKAINWHRDNIPALGLATTRW